MGMSTCAQPGSLPQGNANAAAVPASSTTLMIAAGADVAPGGRARLASASTATMAKGSTRAPRPRPRNG